MYAKLENGHITYPPKHLKENGRYVANYDHHDEALKNDGWKEIVESPAEERNGYYAVPKYIQDGDKIYKSWEYREITEVEEL